MLGNDQITLLFWIILLIIMVFYFLYVGLITYLKNYDIWKYNASIHYIKTINQILNTFFTLYWWVFFTPYVEINSGVFVCGANSFLVEYREDPECPDKPIYLKIVSIIGLVLAVITGLIILYFFRSYEFYDKNLLKRKFNFLFMIVLILRALMTFFYYMALPIVIQFKHVAAQFCGIALVYDIIVNWPFYDKRIVKFYIINTVFFEVSMITWALYIFTEFEKES